MSITAVYKIFSIEKYKVLTKMRSNFLFFFVVYFTALCIPLPHLPPTPTPNPPPKVLLSNDLAKKGRNFFCYVAIRFPHIEMFSFSQIQ